MREYCCYYVGLRCVDGNCPNATADEYDEPRIKCNECWFNEQCKYCALKGTPLCEKEK